jgi:hypothetical protein
MESPFHLCMQVPQHKLKMVCDAWNQYDCIPIREEDCHYTAFIMPWGQFRYKVVLQGYITVGDGYTQSQLQGQDPHG